jgi:hypothetical protein
MTHTIFRSFITVLTFAFGVAAVFVYFNYRSAPVETIQSDSSVEQKNIKSSEKQKIIDSELERNRQIWQNRKIADYNYVSIKVASGMYFGAPVLIKVRKGEAISMKLYGEKGELDRTDGYEDFDTVEKIFTQIQEAIDKGHLQRVKYNKEFGYPEYININSMSSEHSALSIEISKFEIIKN